MLYLRIELPSEEPVQFVGTYVMRWGRDDEPTCAFREATDEEVIEEAAEREEGMTEG